MRCSIVHDPNLLVHSGSGTNDSFRLRLQSASFRRRRRSENISTEALPPRRRGRSLLSEFDVFRKGRKMFEQSGAQYHKKLFFVNAGTLI
jgi:hypothetical protein